MKDMFVIVLHFLKHQFKLSNIFNLWGPFRPHTLNFSLRSLNRNLIDKNGATPEGSIRTKVNHYFLPKMNNWAVML